MKRAKRSKDDPTRYEYRGHTIIDQRKNVELRTHAPWLAIHNDGSTVRSAMDQNKAKAAIDRWLLEELLTPEKKRALNDLWFIYGNYGIRSTPGNHKFIQRFLDGPEDAREDYRSHGLTDQCIKAVDDILKGN